MSAIRGWAQGLPQVLACACLLAGCGSGGDQCPMALVRNSSLITVLAPDGTRVCDANVTVDGLRATIQPGRQDADCAYEVDSSKFGDGAHEAIARKAGYLDAHGTIQVSGGGACPDDPPTGENITLQLVPTEGGVPDGGGADAGPLDASSDGH